MASAALPFWLNRAQAASVAGVVTAAVTVRPAQVGQTPGIFANHASLSAAIACRPQWEALLASALQTSVFLEPAFALSAALHFAVSQRPAFLMVWRTETDMDRPELIGVCPYLTPGFSEFGVARVWNSNQSVLGMPLLHRDYAMQALAAIAVCLASGRTASPALLFTGVPQCGPTDRLIRAFAATSGRSLGTSGETTRACLSGGQAGLAALTGGLSAKQHKELLFRA